MPASAEAADARRFETLDEFWPFYIAQHMNRANRRCHFIGTTLGLACLAGAMLTRSTLPLAPGLVLSYGFAWFGHFVYEKNRPATFEHPFLSLRSDFRMYRLMATASMELEIIRLKQEILRYR